MELSQAQIKSLLDSCLKDADVSEAKREIALRQLDQYLEADQYLKANQYLFDLYTNLRQYSGITKTAALITVNSTYGMSGPPNLVAGVDPILDSPDITVLRKNEDGTIEKVYRIDVKTTREDNFRETCEEIKKYFVQNFE